MPYPSCIVQSIAPTVWLTNLFPTVYSYFNCVVGIKQRLKAHLERLFTSEAEPVALLFEQHVEGKPLYELRHTIAHGTADALSAGEMEGIRQRVWDVERITG